jgi:alpha-galactosidase
MQKQAPNDRTAQMRLMHKAYEKMGKALAATGRPIVYSFCQYGWDAVWEWAPSYGGNLWRTTGDISPHWDRVYTILEQQAGLEGYAGPGHWNDPDMLEVGNGKLSMDENRAHFSMWAMLASPLLAGNDLPNMKPEIKAILTNRDVIALDQDSLGKQASRIYSEGEVEVWSKPLSGGAVAIAVLNAGDNRYSTHPFHLDLAKLGLHGSQQAKDLWTGKDVELTENMPLQIAGHDVFLVRVAQPK